MKKHTTSLLAAILVLTATAAQAETITFVKLTGLTGGTPTGTAIYRSDLSTLQLAVITSITLQDTSFGLGGFTGQFSGYDLDGIRISTVSADTAAAARTVPPTAAFDFSSPATTFTPGTQRIPTNSKLFGTDAAGTAVDNSDSTLQFFDGNSTTAIPGAHGFLSMGDGGILNFILTQPVATDGSFLYIGEVGDNGETIGGDGQFDLPDTFSLEVSVQGIGAPVPEPSSIALMASGLVGLFVLRRRRLQGR